MNVWKLLSILALINKKCSTVIRLMYIKNIYVTFCDEENWNAFTKRGFRRKKHVQRCRSISCHNFQYVFNTVHVHETCLMIERKRKMTSNRSSSWSLSLYETNIDEMSSLTSVYLMTFNLILFVINLKAKLS